MIFGKLLKLLLKIGCLVIQSSIKTKLINQPLDLILTASDTNDPRALKLSNLARHGTSSASSAAHYDEVAGLGFSDAEHAEIGSQPREAKNREVVGKVRGAGGHLEATGGVGTDDGVFLPAGHGADDVARLDGVILGGEDAGDGGAAHYTADRDGGNVGTPICCEGDEGKSTGRLGFVVR